MTLKKHFAVIKLWPELKAAEDENIERLRRTAAAHGLQCHVVDPYCRLVDPPYTQLTQDDIDFVINLHFETPKTCDIFSFAALWNPLDFYYEWGYRRFSPHLTTHDDYLSCSSTWADDHVSRLISRDPTRLAPHFNLYHSLSEPLFEPSLGDSKLFYAGINWERLGKKRARHQDLLDLLDKSGFLRIYGPRLFKGVDVWAGYSSYVGPIPFDGVSMVHEIHRAGISLVLSSPAHKESQLMSNRLFESLAAGAIIIADENPFAKRHFGDTLLYIDTSASADDSLASIRGHINWIRDNPALALEKAKAAQDIFRRQFALDVSLSRLYAEFPERRRKLQDLYAPLDPAVPSTVFFLLPDFDETILSRHIKGALAQRLPALDPVIVIESTGDNFTRPRVQKALDSAGLQARIVSVPFTLPRTSASSSATPRRFGEVLCDLLDLHLKTDICAFVAPNEEIFSDHFPALLRALQIKPEAGAAWSNMLLRHKAGERQFADYQGHLELIDFAVHRPLGLGRFLFRRSLLGRHLQSALRYIDARVGSCLIRQVELVRSHRTSISHDIQHPFALRFGKIDVARENEILDDFGPYRHVEAFAPAGAYSGPSSAAPPFSLENLSDEDKQRFAADLVHSVPVPGPIKRPALALYRWWYHRQQKKPV